MRKKQDTHELVKAVKMNCKGRPRKLKKDEVKEIRDLYFNGDWRVFNLAHAFKVSETCIHQVLDKKGAYREGK